MPIELTKIKYPHLNARQKENYNFLKVSAVLADYGFVTMRLSDDWQGADFVAQHVDGATFLRVQLKSRLTFDKRLRRKDLYVTFPHNRDWYLYPHDELLSCVARRRVIKGRNGKRGVIDSKSWKQKGKYSFPGLSQAVLTVLAPYKISQPRHWGISLEQSQRREIPLVAGWV